MSRAVPAPLFTDPVHHAPTDPVVVEAPDGTWRMLYTQRRAADRSGGAAWVHGTEIGIASSDDGGLTWTYAGVADGLDHLPGPNTLWAPEIVRIGAEYHMFLSHVPGTPDSWDAPRSITHHTSADLTSWTYRGTLPLSSDRVIDACIVPLPSGGYRLWYKDEAAGSQQWSVDSPDLVTWTEPRPVITEPPGEGANVFRLGELVVAAGRRVARAGRLPLVRPRDVGAGRARARLPGRSTVGRGNGPARGRRRSGARAPATRSRGSSTSRTASSPGPRTRAPPTSSTTTASRSPTAPTCRSPPPSVVDDHLVCDRDADPDLDLRRISTLAHP